MSMPLSRFVPASPSPSPCPQVHSVVKTGHGPSGRASNRPLHVPFPGVRPPRTGSEKCPQGAPRHQRACRLSPHQLPPCTATPASGGAISPQPTWCPSKGPGTECPGPARGSGVPWSPWPGLGHRCPPAAGSSLCPFLLMHARGCQDDFSEQRTSFPAWDGHRSAWVVTSLARPALWSSGDSLLVGTDVSLVWGISETCIRKDLEYSLIFSLLSTRNADFKKVFPEAIFIIVISIFLWFVWVWEWNESV